MPPSIDTVEENPNIMLHVISVAGLISSLMISSFGYANNAWITIQRTIENDEFQRGMRGHDCYLTNYSTSQSSVKCLPWDFSEKELKFPEPYRNVSYPSALTKLSMYISEIILLFQVLWLLYGIAFCCSSSFAHKMENFRRLTFHCNILMFGLWALLAIFVYIESKSNSILPTSSIKATVGSGCLIFVYGGCIPFAFSSYCLFREQYGDALKKIKNCRNRSHQHVPVMEHELA